MGEKIRTYGLGVLVGCALAALLFVSRCQMRARERAQQQTQQQQAPVTPATSLPTGPQ